MYGHFSMLNGHGPCSVLISISGQCQDFDRYLLALGIDRASPEHRLHGMFTELHSFFHRSHSMGNVGNLS